MQYVVELLGADRNGRKLIAWGRRIGCSEAGHGWSAIAHQATTKLAVDDAKPSQLAYLLEIADNPQGVLAINQFTPDSVSLL